MKLLTNARIPDGSGSRVAHIAYDETIRRIHDEMPPSDDFSEIVDGNSFIVLPGCIDAHVHFNDPGFTRREDFFTGTAAAAAGGIATIIDMPCTSLPPITDVHALESKLAAIQEKAVVDFALWGGIRGNDNFSEERIEKLWNRGITGFKVYTISGMETFQALPYERIEQLFKTFDGTDILFAFHAEDPNVIKSSTLNPADWRSFPRIRSVEAEVEAVKRILDIQRDNRIHFVHISSKKAANLIIQARNDGRNVTFETCPHYLEFTWDDYATLKGKLKTVPPVKFAEDRASLRQAIGNGTVDYVTTDHAGVDWETGKNLPDFQEVYCGIPGTQTLVPYIISEFHVRRGIPLQKISDLLSANPARRHGLYPRKGSLQPGSDADFTIIDISRNAAFSESRLRSKGKYSPFHNRRFSASIVKTIVRGQTVYDCDNPDEIPSAWGKWVRRS